MRLALEETAGQKITTEYPKNPYFLGFALAELTRLRPCGYASLIPLQFSGTTFCFECHSVVSAISCPDVRYLSADLRLLSLPLGGLARTPFNATPNADTRRKWYVLNKNLPEVWSWTMLAMLERRPLQKPVG